MGGSKRLDIWLKWVIVVCASVSSESANMNELMQWNELYGEVYKSILSISILLYNIDLKAPINFSYVEKPNSHSSLTCYSSLTCDSSSSSSTWVHRCLRADLERTLGSSKRSSAVQEKLILLRRSLDSFLCGMSLTKPSL
ncbi:hypothetical protein L1987_42279 [Smallanthus sonchifolius]|uniref:Uncharacterized protein n=1 Tax=Smallanthus sonchifolius TaxID=185202 RepID=A0ACB9GX37_9ASTR|nr:hypothetical protein L1987_42279 [Smallanthus sonchifolius]